MAIACLINVPTNIGTTRATTTPLVVIGGRNLGCSKLAFSPTILTPALALGQPTTKCTLAILVGYVQYWYGLGKPSGHSPSPPPPPPLRYLHEVKEAKTTLEPFAAEHVASIFLLWSGGAAAAAAAFAGEKMSRRRRR